MKDTRKRPWGTIQPAAVVLAIIVGICVSVLFGGCQSLDKNELEQELRKLGKNAALGTIQRLDFEADLGDGLEQFELAYHHAPAQSPETEIGFPVVLIHGTPSTLFSWTELIYGSASEPGSFEGLAVYRDVYAIEVIGHGIAKGEVSPLTFEKCARFISAAIEALALEQVHLVGSSYGGEFAWRAALNTPELIASLTLSDSSGVRRRAGDWLSEEIQMRENSLAKIGWLLNSEERIELALAPHFKELPPDRVQEFFLVCENSNNWKGMVDLARDENGEREAELSQLEAPTLLLWGANDLAYPQDFYARRFENLIPNSQLVALKDIGHYPHEEAPQVVSEVLTEFFGRIESALQ